VATAPSPLPLDLDPASGIGRCVAKWTAGAGMSLLILFTIAHVQLTEIEVPPPPLADLQTVILNDIPPPPPEIASREPPPPTVLDLEPLPSDNVVKIAIAPLTYEIPLPEANPQLQISLDAFRPKEISADTNPDHIFQYREVDQSPVVVYREKPEIGRSLIRDAGGAPRTIVTMVVTRAGTVRNVEIATTSGNDDIDQLVMDALSRWRFRPAVRRGATVNCLVIQAVIIKSNGSATPFSL